MHYNDAYIDYWGDIYLANPIIGRSGYPFADFLTDPQRILSRVSLAQVGYTEDDAYAPLLAPQQRVMDRLDHDPAALYRRAG